MSPSIKIAFLGECMIELSHQNENTLTLGFAGDTLNSATYFARLTDRKHISVQYVTALGVDPYSERMIRQWQHEGIGVEYVRQLSNKLPGLYLIRNDEHGERFFYFYRSQAAAREVFLGEEGERLCEQLTHFDYLFFSSILLAILDDVQRDRLLKTIARARANGAKICFDINYRPKLWSSQSQAMQMIENTFKLVDIALPSFEDEETLFGVRTCRESAERIHSFGVQEVVVKQGSQGYFLSSAEEQAFVEVVPEKNVVDTTGAGDSFNGAYLAARLQGKSMREAGEAAARLAARVIQFQGAIIPREKMLING